MRTKPAYPVYIISKGRADCCLTANYMIKDGTDFRIVVEPQEEEAYAKIYGKERLLILPFSNLGLGGIPARNWVWEHSIKEGHERHWILDDNIRGFMRRWKGKRIMCDADLALGACEEFIDRYENVAIAGLNYFCFAPDGQKMPPFYLNVHVYSCINILNSIPFRWRGRYNEDTDLCLQALSGGWCTVLMNAFLARKMATLTMKGGNMETLYRGDGRLRMARSLERVWPHVVTVKRRFKRPQHVVRDAWGKFDTPLKLKPGITLDQLTAPETEITLKQVREIKSPNMRWLLDEYRGEKKQAG
jgi:hypothetical protein